MWHAGAISKVGFLGGALVLSLSPIIWLIETWMDPAYASQGAGFFVITFGLFVYSFSSPRINPKTQHNQALLILGSTALVRLLSQILAINTLGALVLAADIYALALLAGLRDRARSVSPFWLAFSFLFCLPVERIVQRVMGYGLQRLSAESACGVLQSFFANVQCAGLRITIENSDVLVDLPCSGARALLLFLFGFTVVASLVRPNLRMAALGLSLALLAAYAANVFRVVMLSAGVALSPETLGIDVMAQPWHDLIGLFCLALAAPIVLVWAVRAKTKSWEIDTRSQFPPAPYRPRPALAAVFLGLCLATVHVPGRPIDVGEAVATPSLPLFLAGHMAQPLTLSKKEEAYFTQYGGSAVRASYGDMALLVTQTRSPLRHLHMPDDCLRGEGFMVDYQGMRFVPFPTAIYAATDPDGAAYHVAVSFRASDGFMTASVAEAVWYWLRHRNTSWTAVQRISPLRATDTERSHFEAAVSSAFDFNPLTAHQPGDIHVADVF